MVSQDEDNSQSRLALGVVFVLITLIVASVIGFAISKSHSTGQVAATTTASAATISASGMAGASHTSAEPMADAASVKVENGVVKFYFASGKADLASGANEALSEVVKAVAAGKTLQVSGFHDASGDPVKNAELAKQRASAVRAALVALGVAESKVELKRPEQTLADGKPSEARRVEVQTK